MSKKAGRTVSRTVGTAVAWLRGLCRRGAGRDAGMVTSEYAMGIIAAVGFALLLYEVVTSGQVKAELQSIVKRALSARM
ncbi:DUF4244 domain-containing protein [Streptomyces sp. NK08204]|uniref:DUF4244 domain-containing protein n=1 Tax=Streptomyces sp. NK08204 TaxID=2873260 RepID=UPI001CEDD7D0|nr:DUF4244 domain-containing protein [Streptomyces sp. NK08204]